MGWPKLLVLVRHAESEGNVRNPNERADYGVGSNFYPLTDHGRQQATLTGKYLQGRFGNFDTYYSSYYTRTNETLSLMYPNAKVYQDPRLAEGQRGIWHVLSEEQMKQRFPEELIRKEREGLYHYRPIGGENWADIELRAHSFLGTLSRDCEDKKVLAAVHGQWLLLLQRLIHHYSIEETVAKYKSRKISENASVTIYESTNVNGKSRLKLVEENLVPWKNKI